MLCVCVCVHVFCVCVRAPSVCVRMYVCLSLVRVSGMRLHACLTALLSGNFSACVITINYI